MLDKSLNSLIYKMDKKIVFFDIDGTLTTETDKTVPESAIRAIRLARENGHKMLINTGRCFQNVEKRFTDIGFDGYVCGCGTNIYCDCKELLYNQVSKEVTKFILNSARELDVDIFFESKYEIVCDKTRDFRTKEAIELEKRYLGRGYDMSSSPDADDFTTDKFIIWSYDSEKHKRMKELMSPYFQCIQRTDVLQEYVPHGFSKATGMQVCLDYYGLSVDDCFVIGDSNNDIPMFDFAKYSIVMGNAEDQTLKNRADFVTKNASEDGIEYALKHYGFITDQR